jgi:hypothetical protein
MRSASETYRETHVRRCRNDIEKHGVRPGPQVEDSEKLLQQRGRESVRVELADTSHEDRPIDAAQETEHVRINAAKLGINVPASGTLLR